MLERVLECAAGWPKMSVSQRTEFWPWRLSQRVARSVGNVISSDANLHLIQIATISSPDARCMHATFESVSGMSGDSSSLADDVRLYPSFVDADAEAGTVWQ